MFAVADGNNFFCSCERVFNSALEGKPVIVLSNNDGCVIARSNEAKQLGIKMGQSFFDIERFVKTHQVAVFSSNMDLYVDMSWRMHSLFNRFCPDTECYSIDESFLHFRGFDQFDLKAHCQALRQTVLQGIGIPVSVGIAHTKTLSKCANKFAKKYQAYNGVCVIDSEDKRIKALQLTDISDVWGVGRKFSSRLQKIGVQSAYDFSLLPQQWVRQNLSVVGERTWLELNGKPCLEVVLEQSDRKSVTVSRSFGQMVGDFQSVKDALINYAVMGAAKLRKEKLFAKKMAIFIDTNRFREDLPQWGQYLVLTLPVATNFNTEIVHSLSQGFEQIFRTGYLYKRAGVCFFDLYKSNEIQGNIWDYVDRRKHTQIMKVLDSVNSKYGRNTIKIASQGEGNETKIKQERLSPPYTTNPEFFPKVF
ncbi:Y-family DNA polymerase [Parabacteroides sp. PF5-9]|uniref:Y-family DNA polymerase n=1 Tax=Parabacteroides sp. PF5-9 TaxID=1742404 RepID=UPI002474524F|nr:Y-family DNA polymerase [Parabacteroides sp. PF5-9]MDH6358949.1 DNA polymerase V [Parabacteroides sp. PF5-9]